MDFKNLKAISLKKIKVNSTESFNNVGNLRFFLDIKVTYYDVGIHLNHKYYVSNLLKKTNTDNAKSVSIPMFAASNVIDTSPLFADTSLCRITTGALQYATVTRPGISSFVNRACQKMEAPTEDDLIGIKRILRYLSGTLGYGLQFRRATSLHLQAYSDADWTGDYLDKRSTSGFFLGGKFNFLVFRKTKDYI
ncbi:uncharacterized protein LOC113351594 [Papaver somniferum]|uniref:uncharacterized protein LOC113351594 n=1 Tax=Papaver somniferum TaxID=3469 RepID=UPI000E6F7437|nr:uncharacterized protein LOC113351594 [Papaver somniferum]